MKTKRIIFIILVFTLCLPLYIFAGGKQEKQPVGSEEKKPVVISLFTDAIQANDPAMKRLAAEFEKKTGNILKYVVVPGQAGEIYQKIDISLMSGDKTDLIDANENYAQKLQNNKLVYHIKKLYGDAKKFDEEFGDYFFLDSPDGGVYAIPNYATYWAVFYNKKIFDDAGVAYPKGSWTWDDYIAIGKKLTDPAKSIYGSYMPLYDNIYYIKADMAGVSGYKPDGSSNYDHPVFKQAMKFYKSLSAEYKIQPSWLEQTAKKWGSTHFLAGKNGMVFISSWYLDVITDYDKYPRDWKIGVTSTPRYKDIEKNNNFGSSSFICINKNSAHPKAALEAALFIAKYSAIFKGNFPPRKNVSREDLMTMFKKVQAGTKNEITVDDLYSAYIDNGLGFYHEKIGGIIANEYSNIIKQEGELYISNVKTLDETIQSIKRRADEAIKQALNK